MTQEEIPCHFFEVIRQISVSHWPKSWIWIQFGKIIRPVAAIKSFRFAYFYSFCVFLPRLWIFSNGTLLRFYATEDELQRAVTWKKFIAVVKYLHLTLNVKRTSSLCYLPGAPLQQYWHTPCLRETCCGWWSLDLQVQAYVYLTHDAVVRFVSGMHTFTMFLWRPGDATQIAKIMGSTWGPPGSCRPQIGPMLAPWTLLSENGKKPTASAARRNTFMFMMRWAPHIMTSSNGNIFRVTGHLCGEFTGPRWIPRTKASDAELWCFLWYASE